jgi:hypothetical protein
MGILVARSILAFMGRNAGMYKKTVAPREVFGAARFSKLILGKQRRFRRFPPKGLTLPIDLENGGAMRIGIYGERMEQTIATTQTAAVEKGPSDDLDLDTMVEYRLLHPSPVKVQGAMQRDVFCHSGYSKFSKRRISHVRSKQSQQAEEEARELGKASAIK